MAGRYKRLDSLCCEIVNRFRGSTLADALQDEARLPTGLQRTGYDADTQTYTFRDANDGSLWESEPENRYGTLHRAGATPLRLQTDDDEEDAMIRHAKREDWRYMAPFFLLIALLLLLVWRFFGPELSFASSKHCPEGSAVYRVQEGDTCWGIAKEVGIGVEELRGRNEGLECEGLRAGRGLCLPEGEGRRRGVGVDWF